MWWLLVTTNTSGDYWGDFDYCDSIAIVGSNYCAYLY